MDAMTLNSQMDAAVEKAAALFGELRKTASISSSTGLSGYSLEEPAKLLMATMQGYFRRLPRFKVQTGQQHEFKVITGVKLPGRKTAAEGERGASASLTLTDYPFKPGTVTSGGFQVTRQAIVQAGSFDNALSRATMLAMKLGLRNEVAQIFGGNPYLLGTPSATASENSTVKSNVHPLNSALTYYVYVRAMTAAAVQDALVSTPNGQALPDPTTTAFAAIPSAVSLLDGYGTPSTVASVATPATTSSINVGWTAIPGAAAYGIFIGTTTGIANAAFVGMVGQTSIVVTDVVLTGTKASTTTAYTDGYGVAQTADTTIDRTVDANAYPGFLSQVFGLTTGGTVVPSGAALLNVNGKLSNAGGSGILEVNELLTQTYYALYQTDDVTLLFSPADRMNLSRALGADPTKSPFRIVIPMGGAQQDVVGGLFADGYVHPNTGRKIPCETEPNIPQGMFLVVPNTLPYPDTNIPNPLAMWMWDEWFSYEYAQVKPTKEYENQCYGGLVLYAPVACAVGYNIFNG